MISVYRSFVGARRGGWPARQRSPVPADYTDAALPRWAEPRKRCLFNSRRIAFFRRKHNDDYHSAGSLPASARRFTWPPTESAAGGGRLDARSLASVGREMASDRRSAIPKGSVALAVTLLWRARSQAHTPEVEVPQIGRPLNAQPLHLRMQGGAPRPSRAAAPDGPAMTPPDSLKARRIASRSASEKVVAGFAVAALSSSPRCGGPSAECPATEARVADRSTGSPLAR